MPRKRKGALPSGNVRVRVFVGTRADGTKRYESFTAHSRQQAEEQAYQFRAYARALIASGVPVDRIPRDGRAPKTDASPSISECLEAYLDTCRATGLSPSTVLSYRRIAARAYGPLRDLPVTRLTLPDLQAYVNARLTSGLSAKSIRCELSLLACALRTTRPDLNMRIIRLPRQPRQEMRIPSTAEVQQMIDAAKETELYLPLLLAALMGLRRSEICGLSWKDVDLRRHTLHIHTAVVRGDLGTYETKRTKTAAGDRTLPIPAALLPVLKRARALDKVTPLTPDAITRRFERLTEQLHLQYRFHDLRHYHASVMIAVGAPEKYITADMGHATMDMVRRVYGHVMEDKQHEINEQMDARAAAFTL